MRTKQLFRHIWFLFFKTVFENIFLKHKEHHFVYVINCYCYLNLLFFILKKKNPEINYVLLFFFKNIKQFSNFVFFKLFSRIVFENTKNMILVFLFKLFLVYKFSIFFYLFCVFYNNKKL